MEAWANFGEDGNAGQTLPVSIRDSMRATICLLEFSGFRYMFLLNSQQAEDHVHAQDTNHRQMQTASNAKSTAPHFNG